MRLIPVDPGNEAHLKVLYELLAERTPEQSISHKRMPTFEAHVEFVTSHPYGVWELIVDGPGEEIVGSVYLTTENEIGVSIFKRCQGCGYGPEAVRTLMAEYAPRQYLANIAPGNEASRRMFEKLGFKTIQHTLALEAE